MEKMTAEKMLQLGHSCGLRTVEDAYCQVMAHYDAFFLISDLQAQTKEFVDHLAEKGLVISEKPGEYRMCGLTIVEAAAKLGITLED